MTEDKFPLYVSMSCFTPHLSQADEAYLTVLLCTVCQPDVFYFNTHWEARTCRRQAV